MRDGRPASIALRGKAGLHLCWYNTQGHWLPSRQRPNCCTSAAHDLEAGELCSCWALCAWISVSEPNLQGPPPRQSPFLLHPSLVRYSVHVIGWELGVPGDRLEKHWPRLRLGDCISYLCKMQMAANVWNSSVGERTWDSLWDSNQIDLTWEEMKGRGHYWCLGV